MLWILKGEMPFKMHKTIFPEKEKILKKYICMCTIPKIFRPVTLNILIFLFGLRLPRCPCWPGPLMFVCIVSFSRIEAYSEMDPGFLEMGFLL